MPQMKMPHVDLSLSKGKPLVEGPDVDIKGDGGQFKMPNVTICIPKGKANIDASAEKMEAEGGGIKMPHIKMPKVDVSLPKGKSKDIEVPALAMEVTGPDVKLPKGEISMPKVERELKMPQVTSPDLDAGAHVGADLHVEGEHKGVKLKMPTIDIKGPKGDLELDIGLHRGEGKKDRKRVELPDLDLNTSGTTGKVKGPKVKGTKFKIGMPKKKWGGGVAADSEAGTHNGHKDRVNISGPEVTPPSISLKAGTGVEGAEIKVPRIPDIDFDIGTSPDEDDDKTEKGKKIKIPKFGVPLPSMSSPEGRMNIYGQEIEYEGPKMPKVKKAVFVLVNPPATDESSPSTSLPKEEATAEAEMEDVKVKMPKIKLKPTFGKSKDKSAAEKGGEEEEKSKGGKMKLPKVSFSSSKSSSLNFAHKEEGSSSSLNGEKDANKGSKDDKGTFSGKIKLPKVEFTSPYGKMSAGEENPDPSLGEIRGDVKVKPDKMAFAGFSEESSKEVVSSHARTEMLDRDSSESPPGFLEFTSTKFQGWTEMEGRESEERESSSWFKVPKISLKPHSTGFLQITPEGSPRAQRKGEVGGDVDVSGSFCLHTSALDFTSEQMSEERHISSTEEGTVTTVTKTTRITRQLVTTESGESATTTTTTRQVTDF